MYGNTLASVRTISAYLLVHCNRFGNHSFHSCNFLLAVENIYIIYVIVAFVDPIVDAASIIAEDATSIIQVIGGSDLIICGRQTTDGDTAQVGYTACSHSPKDQDKTHNSAANNRVFPYKMPPD